MDPDPPVETGFQYMSIQAIDKTIHERQRRLVHIS